MATRFYFGKILTDTVPTFSATWQQASTTAPIRALMRTVKTKSLKSSAPFVQTTTEAVVTGGANSLCAQFISRPLDAQTITGTVKGYALFSEAVATQDCTVRCEIRVISPTGTVRSGTSIFNGGTEFAAGTATNSRIPAAASGTLTSVTAQAGDFLVVEIGFISAPNGVTSVVTFQWHDDTSTGDLPEDETTTDTTLAPWLEFSQTLVLQDQFDNGTSPSVGSLGVTDLSGLPAPSFIDKSIDTLLEFAPPSLSIPLVARQANQTTDNTNPTFLQQQTLGDVATAAFDDTQVRQFAPATVGITDVAAMTALNQTLCPEPTYGVPEFSPPAISFNLVEPSQDAIAVASISSTRYINRVYDTTAAKFVRWITDTVADTTGIYYPGPGTFNVHTSDYVIEASYTL